MPVTLTEREPTGSVSTGFPVGSSSPVEVPSTPSKQTSTGMPGIVLPGIVS